MVIIILVLLVLLLLILRKPVEKYSYKSYLLTIPSARERREVFFQYTDHPVEVVYGKDTRDVATARTFEHMVQPEFFNKAVEMHYDSSM
jgi:hypothetical protein